VVAGVHVEPFVCFYIMSRTLMLLPTQNLSLRKACRVNLRLDNATCTVLEDDPSSASAAQHDGEVATQQLVTQMFIWQMIIQSSVPCVLAILMGSWSDRNRRRVPCMLMPVASELVHVAGLLVCVYYFYELPMEMVGIADAVPTALAGGRMVLFNAMFSYISDVSKVSLGCDYGEGGALTDLKLSTVCGENLR
jgi:PCFT/HCP family folate transporter-like MFS transporter 1/3